MKENFFQPRNIYYKTSDFEPGRPTIVFIHGLSGSSSAWIKYEEKFQDKYNVMSYDLRGHGKSERPRNFSQYELKNFAEDLFELLKFLKIENPVLVSHSFGTLVAMEFLVKHQDIARAAVFLSPNFAVRKMKLAKITEPLFNLTKIFDFLPFKKTGSHVDYERFKNTGDWNLRRCVADLANTGLMPYFYCTRQSYKFDREKFLAEINVPVLIMHGKKDTIFPVENSLIMAERISNSRLILLDNADHILVLNYFDEVSQAIEDFINKVSK